MFSEHERPAAWIVPEQQASDPPGRPLQPVPPHVPQLYAQQTWPDRIPVLHSGSDITQGGPLVVQETPALRMLVKQQALPPPGRVEQPAPPQLPQAAAQQTPFAGIPVEQVGSQLTQTSVLALIPNDAPTWATQFRPE
jgi:hypothetical protein